MFGLKNMAKPEITAQTVADNGVGAAPASWDWRSQGKVNPVKD
jgi:hypothetical protein